MDLTSIWIDMWEILGDTLAIPCFTPEGSRFCLQVFLSTLGLNIWSHMQKNRFKQPKRVVLNITANNPALSKQIQSDTADAQRSSTFAIRCVPKVEAAPVGAIRISSPLCQAVGCSSRIRRVPAAALAARYVQDNLGLPCSSKRPVLLTNKTRESASGGKFGKPARE